MPLKNVKNDYLANSLTFFYQESIHDSYQKDTPKALDAL